MRLDARALGLAGGATAAMLFIICASAVAIAPGPTTVFAGYLIHMNLSSMSRSLTLGSFVVGLICWTVGTSLTFWLVATVYNRLIGGGAGRS